ncbi:hypothetical protein ANTQUA_LOCUS1355 [Anthophora quadrimaculata]
MDDIMIYKTKYTKITDLQIKDLLQNQIKLLNAKIKQSQNCNEVEIKIKELTSSIISMRESLESEKQILEHKEYDLSKHLDYITTLEAEKNKFLEENQSLELQRNKLKTCKRNLQDQELLDQGRRKFSLYKEVTTIRWDYERLKESVAGCVTNKKQYIHYFCYANDNTKNLADLLWQEIYQSTVHTENQELCDKENIVTNK